jgi:hypothetical protein
LAAAVPSPYDEGIEGVPLDDRIGQFPKHEVDLVAVNLSGAMQAPERR